jgi:four helix bundle protein
MMHNFRKMKIWEDARKLVSGIYTLTQKIPASERYGLISQIQRAAISIPANIAEGSGRTGNKEFCRFLDIAIGSALELETLIIIAGDLGFISEEETIAYTKQISDLDKMILSFKQQLQQND